MSKYRFLPFQIHTIIFIFVSFFTKWLPAAILVVQNSLSMAFLSISDQYKTFFFNFFYKMAGGAHLGCSKFTLIPFLAISDRYATLIYFEIFDKMAAAGHFGCPKFTFNRISGHFRSICNFIFFGNF